MKVEGCTFRNGVLIEHTIKELDGEWKSAKDDPIMKALEENKGLGLLHPGYLSVNDIQEEEYELRKIMRFLAKFFIYYAEQKGLDPKELKLEFINHGKTELVFLLTEKDGESYTLLVKQPSVRYGDIYKEHENLLKLQKHDNMVVAPLDYYTYGEQELYVTPYIKQARCIASKYFWGIYIPEPFYRMQKFTPEQESIVTSCMIAKLISLYDREKNEGLANVKLGGGDFMLPKGWEVLTPTIENTLNSLYLIAAREMTNCSLDDYIELIRSEYKEVTIDKESIINLRGRVPIKESDIEAGIDLGLKLLGVKYPDIENKKEKKYND